MRPLVALFLLLLGMPAVSDESAVYESTDDLAIGPVFLTPGERRWLDANRHLAARDDAAQSAAPAAADDEVEAARPAGYIVNSSGQMRRYGSGGFSLSAASPSSMRFPDDVEIRRHVSEREADARGADEEGPDDEIVED